MKRAKTTTASWQWVELPYVELALRTGTALLITTAAALVLLHLTVYSSGSLSRGAIPAGPPAACFIRGC